MSIQKVDKSTGNTSLICGSTLWAEAPLGTIFPLMSNNIPTGFLLCDNTAYRASDYPELWAILPSTVKDTVNNTFTIDLRESTLKGVGLTSKSNNHYDSDGLALGEFIDDRLQDHYHYLTTIGINDSAAVQKGIGTYSSGTLKTSNVADARKGATTEVKAVGVNYIIKAKMVAMPSDFMSKVEEAVSEVTVSNMSVRQDIRAYTTSSPFIAPCDGYLRVSAWHETATVNITSPDDTTWDANHVISIRVVSTVDDDGMNENLFIRKGMKIANTSTATINYSVYFYSLTY